MTKNKFTVRLLGITLFLAFIHFILNQSYLQRISIRNLIEMEALTFILVLMGLVILLPAVEDKNEKFIARFMITTTVQMLGLLSYVVYVFVLKYEQIRFFSIDLLLLFVAILSVQSILLIRSRSH